MIQVIVTFMNKNGLGGPFDLIASEASARDFFAKQKMSLFACQLSVTSCVPA